jgi:hypothetical protein
MFHHGRFISGAEGTGLIALPRMECWMSKVDELRQYADEALRWAAESTTEREKDALIELARTWMLAAARMEGSMGPHDSSRIP